MPMQSAVVTHSQIIKAKALAVAQRLSPGSSQLPPVTLDVKNGVHQGSVLELDNASFSIGPTSETDVMLLDDEALGGNATITISGSLFGPVFTVTTKRSDVRVNGVIVKPDGGSASHVLPCIVDFNGIRFELRTAQKLRPKLFVYNEGILAPLLLAAATMAFGAQAYLSSRPPTLAFDMPEPQQQTASVAKLESSENLVREMIGEVGLSERLNVAQTGTDMLVISGELPPALMPEWRRIRGDVDRAVGGVAIVSNVSASVGLSELPPVAAVTLGPQPAVHLTSGKTLNIGDAISGDWVIVAIDINNIEIMQGNDVLTIAF